VSDDKRRYETGQLIAAMLQPTKPTGLFARYSRRRPEPEVVDAAEPTGDVDHMPVDPLLAFLRTITGHNEQGTP
jgi:hypothetical protein